MRESAPPVDATLFPPPLSNVVAFRGGRFARPHAVAFRGGQFVRPHVVEAKADPDALLLAAGKIEGLHDSVAAVRAGLAGSHILLPSGTLERLAAIESQIEVLAKMVEHDALVAQGCGELA